MAYAGSGLPQGLLCRENKLFPVQVGLELVFVNLLKGLKVGKKWLFGCKSGSECVKTHFLPTLNPFRDIDKNDQNPFLTHLKGGGNCSMKRAFRPA